MAKGLQRDVYYRRAKELACRARSAFKLIHVDEHFNIFHPLDGRVIRRVVDLCAAPGSWSQVIQRELAHVPNAHIVAVDIQEIAPIKDVICLQGDISAQTTAEAVIQACEGKADLVVCDGAPDVTGIHDIDEVLQEELVFAALRITLAILDTGGTFVSKFFSGHNSGWMLAKLGHWFEEVYTFKPTSSRESSAEKFLVCLNLRPLPQDFDLSMNRSLRYFKDYMKTMPVVTT